VANEAILRQINLDRQRRKNQEAENRRFRGMSRHEKHDEFKRMDREAQAMADNPGMTQQEIRRGLEIAKETGISLKDQKRITR